MIANDIKKQIIDEWSKEFVDLSAYTQNKLYKILGAFVIGIEILSLPRTEEYRPIFVCYPLWKSDIKKCLDEPIFLLEIYNKKGFQFNISYKNHNTSFQEAVECTKKQVPILSHKGIPLHWLLEFINRQFSQTLIKSSPVGQAKLLEGELFAALYLNDTIMIKKVLEELIKTSKTWSPSLFEWKYKKLDAWLQDLQEIISNRNEFLKQIESNKQNKKIAKLPSSDLIV